MLAASRALPNDRTDRRIGCNEEGTTNRVAIGSHVRVNEHVLQWRSLVGDRAKELQRETLVCLNDLLQSAGLSTQSVASLIGLLCDLGRSLIQCVKFI